MARTGTASLANAYHWLRRVRNIQMTPSIVVNARSDGRPPPRALPNLDPSERVRYRLLACGPKRFRISLTSSPHSLKNSDSRVSGKPKIQGSPQFVVYLC